MVNDALVEPLDKIKGIWEVSSYYCRDEIVREEYLSLDAYVFVVLQKEDNFWIYEAYLREKEGAKLIEEDGSLGTDSYRQAYGYFSEFSEKMADFLNLKNAVSRLDYSNAKKLDID